MLKHSGSFSKGVLPGCHTKKREKESPAGTAPLSQSGAAVIYRAGVAAQGGLPWNKRTNEMGVELTHAKNVVWASTCSRLKCTLHKVSSGKHAVQGPTLHELHQLGVLVRTLDSLVLVGMAKLANSESRWPPQMQMKDGPPKNEQSSKTT